LAGESACPTNAVKRLAVGGAGGSACDARFFYSFQAHFLPRI
jgi:hypothetical protein